MKIGINRNKITIEVAEKQFVIGIVPIHAQFLIAQHDTMETDGSFESDVQKMDHQLDVLYECVQDILEANGYEFDREWWEVRLDIFGFQEFVVACLSKDIPADSKKKAVGA